MIVIGSDGSPSSSDDDDAGRGLHDDSNDDSSDEHDDDGDGGSGSESSSGGDDDSSGSSNSSSVESDDERGRRRRRGRHGRHDQRRGRERARGRRKRPSVKDLELPTFTRSPKVAVSTWIDRVDLALKEWSHASEHGLKKTLRFDKPAAEWRVSMRRMMPGETYADFAAGLRDVVGRNKVSERVLLAQFYRCLDKTTRKLVTQDPEPKTLEEAVDNASEIDYPMDNAARGMMNIGQPWATAPSPHLVPMTGTSGQTVVIPGIGGARLPAEMTSSVRGVTAAEHDADAVALFTNPQGVWNIYIPLLGTYRLVGRGMVDFGPRPRRAVRRCSQ
ncbi:hypothetical protein L915_11455 [Phytophthora nicotianae]|uniref:Retrotransposon gag domain-containing protein n=1 Tax=Phytophthora nicotianae TaxID=4792 RepID=W2GJW6_PHYNI|nr:hypothetical protein L915_11455 [Phytophthora nicotianae]